MRLYINTMDAVLVDLRADGWIRFEKEDWIVPSLQERRAILHAASDEIASLKELIEVLDRGVQSKSSSM